MSRLCTAAALGRCKRANMWQVVGLSPFELRGSFGGVAPGPEDGLLDSQRQMIAIHMFKSNSNQFKAILVLIVA